MRTVTLAELRTRALRLADLENNNSWIQSAELNDYVNEAVAKWWDIIASSQCHVWFQEWYLGQTEPNVDTYPLDPSPQGFDVNNAGTRFHAQTNFYKFLGVDVIYGDFDRLDSGNPKLTRSASGFLSLPRNQRRLALTSYMNNERNWPNDHRWAEGSTTDYQWAQVPPRYRISGDTYSGQAGSFADIDSNLSTANASERTPLISFIPAPETTYWYRIWYMPHAPELVNDGDLLTTINGWEEYIVADVAQKIITKEEGDPSAVMAIKQEVEASMRDSSDELDISSNDAVQDFYRTCSNAWGSVGAGSGTKWEASKLFDSSEKTVASIAVTPASATINNGATQQYAATATYEDGTTADVTNDALLTWSSSDSGIASIDDTGLATSVDVAGGTVTITATWTPVGGSALNDTASLTCNAGVATYVSSAAATNWTEYWSAAANSVTSPRTWGIILQADTGTATNSGSYFAQQANGGATAGWSLYDAGSNNLRFRIANGVGTASNATAISFAGWPGDGMLHIVAGTFDGITFRTFLDGSELSTTAIAGYTGDATATFSMPTYNGSFGVNKNWRIVGFVVSDTEHTSGQMLTWMDDCKAAIDVVNFPAGTNQRWSAREYVEAGFGATWNEENGNGPNTTKNGSPTNGTIAPVWDF